MAGTAWVRTKEERIVRGPGYQIILELRSQESNQQKAEPGFIVYIIVLQQAATETGLERYYEN